VNTNELTTAEWFKSSRSNGQNACVEVAFLDGGDVALRDTKDQGRGPIMVFTAAEWDAFVGGVQDGEFDRPA
jgi:Domain of unknown function (DUF397)